MSPLLIFIIETQCVLRDLEYETEEIVWNRNMTIEHDKYSSFRLLGVSDISIMIDC